jgi:hypothetical protein
MTREVLEVFCPKNNHVGAVYADAEAGVYKIRYTAEVSHQDGSIFPSPKEAEAGLFRDVAGTATGYCRTCNRPVMLDYLVLLRKVDEGAKHHHAPFADSMDKQWRRARREPMYPPGTTRRKDDPRRAGQ